MALTPAETAQLRALLQDFPPARKAGAFASDLAGLMTTESRRRGVAILEEGTPADALYLLAGGRVMQTLAASGQQWFQQEARAGMFLGGQSLLNGQHQTRAVVLEDATLFRLAAADLHLLLDRYPELHEVLLNEQRASRLRSIPLFESLTDADIRWLAQLVEEEWWEEGTSPDLVARPGVRVVDWGQVAVRGPAALAPGWRLTAGNFFFTLRPGAQLGPGCAVTQATAVRQTHLYFLASQHFNRLVAVFPEVHNLALAPLDIPAWLARVPLFAASGMSAEHRRHLAQFAAWEFVPANQNITSQGEVGFSFILMLKGGGLVSAVDDQGRLRPRNLCRPGDAFGATSLLESKLRDATVRAVTGQGGGAAPVLNGAEIINLDRRDLQVAFAECPELWHPGVPLYDRYQQLIQERPRYRWMAEGEMIVWSDRPHWLWLAGPLIAIFLIAALFPLAAGIGGLPGWMNAAGMIALGLVAVPVTLYVTSNYLNDYYVITNQRVTRRDRVLFIRETRNEAPLDQVQDITVNATLIGRLANYGNVTIRTAAKGISIQFTHVPNPDTVKELIMREKLEAVAAVRGRNREVLRQGLMNGLRIALAVPDLDKLRALGQHAEPRVEGDWWQEMRQRFARPPGRQPNRWAHHLLARLPERTRLILLGPPPADAEPEPRPAMGEVVWHKHWLNLLQRTFWPLLGVVVLLVAGAGALANPEFLGPDNGVPFFLVWLVLMAPAASWLAWNWVDYRNDIYVVTDEKIIDIEKRPLALSSKRQESSLDRIQTVIADQKGFWANLLDYGNVNIRTAAGDEGFTFNMVPSPKEVQQTVFQKLDAFRRRNQQREIAQRQREIIEGLELYHDLRGDGRQGTR